MKLISDNHGKPMRTNNNRKWLGEKAIKICEGAGLLFRIGPRGQFLYLAPRPKKNRAQLPA